MTQLGLPEELRHQAVHPAGDVCNECGHELQLNPGAVRAPNALARHWNDQHLFVKIRVLVALLEWLDCANGPTDARNRLAALAAFRHEGVDRARSFVGGVRIAVLRWRQDGSLEEAMDEDPCPDHCLRPRPHLIDGPYPFRVCTECYAEELCARGPHPGGGHGRL